MDMMERDAKLVRIPIGFNVEVDFVELLYLNDKKAQI